MKRSRWRSLGRGLLLTLAVLLLLWLIAQVIPPRGTPPPPHPALASQPGRPWIIAHAGGLGLQPENTLEAFTASAALGCDQLEMDIRLTRDGVLVTHHDPIINRTSNGSGPVLDHTLAELKALNFGARFRDASGAQPYRDRPAHIATLEEVFTRFPQLPMTIELKDRGETGRQAGRVLAGLIARFQRTNSVVIASFDDATLNAFRDLTDGRVPTSAAKGETRSFVLLSLLGLDRLWAGSAAALQVPSNPREASGFQLARPGFLRAAHARNVAVHYWTVNDPDEMRRLIAMGADGLITDFPNRLKAILATTNSPASP